MSNKELIEYINDAFGDTINYLTDVGRHDEAFMFSTARSELVDLVNERKEDSCKDCQEFECDGCFYKSRRY